MFRPEYLLVGAAFVVLAAIRVWRAARLAARRSPAPRCSSSPCVLPIVPWTVRNVVVLDRVVPISTGGGKALYVGTYLPADGEYQRVKAILVERYPAATWSPTPRRSTTSTRPRSSTKSPEVSGYPDLSRDEALGKIGKENFYKYFGEDPVGYAAMTVRKVGRMWSSGVGEAMSSTAGRVVQVLLVALGLAGFVLLALRRRWWELVVLATPIVLVTAVGAVSLAAPRRNEVLMTLVFPLAGLALSAGARGHILRPRMVLQQQASSPPN